MFRKILIANRGEIACRVIDTAHKLGIRCVAVYSEADANARHVRMADEAYLLGPAPSKDSYLRADKIIAIAKQSGAEAIHPGYGFLSENESFAKACDEAGVVFIGPPVGAITAMGSKSAAKDIMAKAGVPLVPGYHGDDQSDALLSKESERIGYPQLLKAAYGGGGKGMRVVWKQEEFADALASARREAKAGFGNDKMLIERYLTKPRHIEIQVFADNHGNAVYLAERDCSIQRRHQKLLEETPSPFMIPELREKMGDAAVKAALAVSYEGVGTVEFLVDKHRNFYFMEMNTRIQVEHPVTEEVINYDLIKEQIKIAAGIEISGINYYPNMHAIECRINAEDPYNNFRPSPGRITNLHVPGGHGVRVDSHVYAGYTIPSNYDSMISKLITIAQTREEAIQTMERALSEYVIEGVKTTIPFHQQLMQNEDFRKGNYTTKFLESFQLK